MKLENITKHKTIVNKLTKLHFSKVLKLINDDKRFKNYDKNNMVQMLGYFAKVGYAQPTKSEYHNLDWVLKVMDTKNYKNMVSSIKFSHKDQLRVEFSALNEAVLDVRNKISFANDYTYKITQ